MRALCIVRWRGGGGAAPRPGGAGPGRSAEAGDALHVLRVAGVLLGPPVLAWALSLA